MVLRLALWYLLVSTIAEAQLTGTFSGTASMITPRYLHTATMLLDGTVLIAGGVPKDWPDTSLLTSAELYDPATGVFDFQAKLALAIVRCANAELSTVRSAIMLAGKQMLQFTVRIQRYAAGYLWFVR